MIWTAWVIIGAIFGGLGVGLGAFGAHGLRNVLDQNQLNLFDIGVRYQMYHALALLLHGLLATKIENIWMVVAGLGFTFGILLFSGSLYGYALSGTRWLVFMTPIGGGCLLLGWLCLVVGLFVQ